jgi:CheY-like chemotaxis protein
LAVFEEWDKMAKLDRAASALVVDTDTLAAQRTVGALEAAGFGVLFAHSGQAARVAARQRAVQLIVCDLYVDDESGVELVRQLRELPALEEVPAMFLSLAQKTSIIRRSDGVFDRTGSSVDRRTGLTHCAYHLRKPVDPAVLAELAMAEVARAWRAIDCWPTTREDLATTSRRATRMASPREAAFATR